MGIKDYVTLGKNDSFMEELKTSLILNTVNDEDVESVELIVEGLGFEDVRVMGISSKSFLAFFPTVETLEELDLDFMEMGFAGVSKVKWMDLCPPRRPWIECRGLPVVAWTDENFKTLISPWGRILRFSPTLDEEGFLQSPKLQIETTVVKNIYQEVTTDVMGKCYNVLIQECPGGTNNGKGSTLCKSSVDVALKEHVEREENGGIKLGALEVENKSDFMHNGIENKEISRSHDGDLQVLNAELNNNEEQYKSAENVKPLFCLSPSRVSDSHLVLTQDQDGLDHEEVDIADSESGIENSLINPLTPIDRIQKDHWRWNHRNNLEDDFSASGEATPSVITRIFRK